jgi:hypothetical protein
MSADNHIYVLTYKDQDGRSHIFYVGRTGNPKKREADHRNNSQNPRHDEYETHKYQWCRRHPWQFEVLCEASEDYDEYSAILEISRINSENGVSFINGDPLTNMKAGDFWAEMIADRSVATTNRDHYVRYRSEREREATNYERDTFGDQSQRRTIPPIFIEEERRRRAHIPKGPTDWTFKGYDHSIARAEYLRQQTEEMIRRDRAEGRSLPGGVSDDIE